MNNFFIINTAFAQGTNDAGFFDNLAKSVDNIYKYSIGVAGLLAFGILVYAGVLYIFSAGGVANKEEAKKWITSSITGLILLLSAVIILNFFPGILELKNTAPPVPPPGPVTRVTKTTDAIVKDIQDFNINVIDFKTLSQAAQQDVLSKLTPSRRSALLKDIDNYNFAIISDNRNEQNELKNRLRGVFNLSVSNPATKDAQRKAVIALDGLVRESRKNKLTRYADLTQEDKIAFENIFNKFPVDRNHFLYASRILTFEDLEVMLSSR